MTEPTRPRQPPYRDGRVHVLVERCASCILRPGNLMHLAPGRLAELVAEARAHDSAIVCHETAGDAEAVCRGFADRWPTTPLRMAEQLGVLEPVPAPREWWGRPSETPVITQASGVYSDSEGAARGDAAGVGQRPARERGPR